MFGKTIGFSSKGDITSHEVKRSYLLYMVFLTRHASIIQIITSQKSWLLMIHSLIRLKVLPSKQCSGQGVLWKSAAYPPKRI